MVLKLEVGKTYASNCGRKVRIVCTDRKNSTLPCIGLGDWGDFEPVIYFQADGYATPSFYLVREYDPLEDNVAVSHDFISWDVLIPEPTTENPS